MKRVIAAVIVLALASLVLAPVPAQANGRFWGAFVAGGLAGVIIGGALATPQYVPPPVVYPYPPYAQPPGYYAAPPPGYAPGYPGAGPVYIPPQWVWNGYQWVWQPGYWRY
jgi:hypothetical protein